jgi:hypothetical protein
LPKLIGSDITFEIEINCCGHTCPRLDVTGPPKAPHPFSLFFLPDNGAITPMRLDGASINKKILIGDSTDQCGKEITEY